MQRRLEEVQAAKRKLNNLANVAASAKRQRDQLRRDKDLLLKNQRHGGGGLSPPLLCSWSRDVVFS